MGVGSPYGVLSCQSVYARRTQHPYRTRAENLLDGFSMVVCLLLLELAQLHSFVPHLPLAKEAILWIFAILRYGSVLVFAAMALRGAAPNVLRESDTMRTLAARFNLDGDDFFEANKTYLPPAVPDADAAITESDADAVAQLLVPASAVPMTGTAPRRVVDWAAHSAHCDVPLDDLLAANGQSHALALLSDPPAAVSGPRASGPASSRPATDVVVWLPPSSIHRELFTPRMRLGVLGRLMRPTSDDRAARVRAMAAGHRCLLCRREVCDSLDFGYALHRACWHHAVASTPTPAPHVTGSSTRTPAAAQQDREDATVQTLGRSLWAATRGREEGEVLADAAAGRLRRRSVPDSNAAPLLQPSSSSFGGATP